MLWKLFFFLFLFQCITHLNDLIWKYNVVTLDRLVLSLVSEKRGYLTPFEDQRTSECHHLFYLSVQLSQPLHVLGAKVNLNTKKRISITCFVTVIFTLPSSRLKTWVDQLGHIVHHNK